MRALSCVLSPLLLRGRLAETVDYVAPDFSSAALVTIDTQVDTLDGQPLEITGTSAAVSMIAALAAAFRKAGRPIVHLVRLYRAHGSSVDPVAGPRSKQERQFSHPDHPGLSWRRGSSRIRPGLRSTRARFLTDARKTSGRANSSSTSRAGAPSIRRRLRICSDAASRRSCSAAATSRTVRARRSRQFPSECPTGVARCGRRCRGSRSPRSLAPPPRTGGDRVSAPAQASPSERR